MRKGADSLALTLYRKSPQHWNANSTAIAGALFGLLIILILGAAHASNLLSTSYSSLSFVFIFLLPLVTGAASYLIPLWIRPGMQTEWHARTRLHLAQFGLFRLVLFIAAGIFITLGSLEWGWVLAGIALGLFLFQLHGLTRGTT